MLTASALSWCGVVYFYLVGEKLAMNNEVDQEINHGRTTSKKLSKEHYIELAAFSDSIYDRGRLGFCF